MTVVKGRVDAATIVLLLFSSATTRGHNVTLCQIETANCNTLQEIFICSIRYRHEYF
jgi:hypothetical protein